MELKCEQLSRQFHNQYAVDHVSFAITQGVHALLGANGSGKTTLIRMLAGLLPPTTGAICFDNVSIQKQYNSYCATLGYMPQHFGYYPNYTVEEFLSYMGLLKCLPKKVLQPRIEELLVQLNLRQQRKRKMKQLSGGMLRRVGIAQALLAKPQILLLDEPTAGLDPKERIVFRNLIAALAKECTILLSTHIVSDIESIADDVLVMKEGKIIAHDSCDALLASMENKVWEVTVDDRQAQALIQAYTIVKTHQQRGTVQLRLLAEEQPHPQAANVQPDLDDYYLYHFQEESADDGQTDSQ